MAQAMLTTTTLEAKWSAAYKMFWPKIRTWAKNSVHLFPGWDRCDVEQELLTVLHLAVLSYDPLKGAGFNSYTQDCFKRKISDLKRKAIAVKRQSETNWIDLDDAAIRSAVEAKFQEMSAEQMAEAYGELRTMSRSGIPRRTEEDRKPRRRAS